MIKKNESWRPALASRKYESRLGRTEESESEWSSTQIDRTVWSAQFSKDKGTPRAILMCARTVPIRNESRSLSRHPQVFEPPSAFFRARAFVNAELARAGRASHFQIFASTLRENDRARAPAFMAGARISAPVHSRAFVLTSGGYRNTEQTFRLLRSSLACRLRARARRPPLEKVIFPSKDGAGK